MASGSFSKAYRGYTLKTEWKSTSSASTNKSTITCTHYLICASGYDLYINGRTNSCTVNGVKQDFNSSAISTPGNSTIKLGTTSYTVEHNADGKKSVSASTVFYFKATISGTYVESITASGTMVLDNIPRYATVTQTLSDKTETSILIKWSSDSAVDYVWHSVDDGLNWFGYEVSSVQGLPSSSGILPYVISGLKANTTYKIKTRVRRKDSQLTTDSSTMSVTTYDYPHCTNTPDFTIGSAVTLKFYNPLSRTFKFFIVANGTQITKEYSCSGTTYKGINDADIIPLLYQSIPNSQNGKYKVKVVYDGSQHTYENGNTFKIKGTEKPSVGSVSYADTESRSVNITGNNQHIVQNQSNLLVTYTEATAKNSATISSYTFELNEVVKTSTSPGGTVDFGKVNSSSDLTLKMTVTDSRGLTSSKSIPVTMIAYQEPSAVVTVERKNNYEDETYITVDSSISDVNGNNAVLIMYRYALQGTSDYSEITYINDKETHTLSLDKNKVFTFRVAVLDSFTSMWTTEVTLGKGVFPLFIDTALNSIGINTLPTEPNALEIEGKILGIQNRLLWSGSELMDGNTTIELEEIVSKQMTGIVLVWSPCNEEGAVQNVGFNFTYVPKIHTLLHNGKGVVCRMSGGTPFRNQGSKYLYIYDDKIVGNASNTTSGTSDSGVNFDNSLYALRYVVGM